MANGARLGVSPPVFFTVSLASIMRRRHGRHIRHAPFVRAFGNNFEAIELEDGDAAPADRPPHSVLTIHIREDGPTKAAEQRVIAFFKERTGAHAAIRRSGSTCR